MKKIILLSIIMVSAIAVSAQYGMVGNDNMTTKTTQVLSNASSSDGFLESISVYPNPVVDILKVSFRSNKNGKVIISLFNNIGKQTFSLDSEVEPGINIVSIDLRSKGIEPGIYFVQIKIGKNVETRKLIVK